MDDKTKLYVLAKKEVFLIFVFMILISLTSFLLGVKIGVNNSFESSGFTREDMKNVEIMSPDEEKVTDLETSMSKVDQDATYKALKEKTNSSLRKKIENEFSNEDMKFNIKKPEAKMKDEAPVIEKKSTNVMAPATAPVVNKKDEFSGKHSIQVGSFPSINEAELFAKGFKARGYTPIINQVELSHRGTWFRVSLGVFENVSEAKEYVIEHRSLFESSDYHFVQFE
ncbi:hypothetical protein A9Q84_09280 [Halobacteriovorax marinus]|uniref:SPOR domain-containing protein n=1 Tax=Halobacteriovorax marinus TaxID=97084 RepID=A0A1Y5FAL7_9BACT|nr:hypothetical protein A9Q84_09280 [Halobacteriovorax marinus]